MVTQAEHELQNKTVEEIYENTYDTLRKAVRDKKIYDDAVIVSGALGLVERIIPHFLKRYKKDKKMYEMKQLAMACSLRVTISAIMPFSTFQRYMRRKDMKVIDEMIRDVRKTGHVRDGRKDELFEIFKENDRPIHAPPPGMYT